MFSAAIFDMDGLLIDSERSIMRAWQSAAAEVGVVVSDDQYASVIGRAATQSDAHLSELLGGESVFHQVRDQVRSRLGVFPPKIGATELLLKLTERQVPCAVASSTGVAEVRRRLESVGLASFFVAIAGGDEVPIGKPDPSVYLLAAHRLGASPSQCLAFEDSQNGKNSAVAAGMSVVLVPDLTAPDASGCLLHISSLVEAMEHVDRWFPAPNLSLKRTAQKLRFCSAT
jgi:beta-phosphoglucomutase-like phosphatase (HAD superfamily)